MRNTNAWREEELHIDIGAAIRHARRATRSFGDIFEWAKVVRIIPCRKVKPIDTEAEVNNQPGVLHLVLGIEAELLRLEIPHFLNVVLVRWELTTDISSAECPLKIVQPSLEPCP